jgi:hypothetical protein
MMETRVVNLPVLGGGDGDVDVEGFSVLSGEQQDLLRKAFTIPGAHNEIALPVWHESAVAALEQCDRADVAVKFTNMAERAALLARQAKDDRMMVLAGRIRMRAWRRLGELLNEIPAVQCGPTYSGETPSEARERKGRLHEGPRPASQPTRTAMARAAGIAAGTATKAQQIATIPQKTFDELLEAPKPVSGGRLVEIAKMLGSSNRTTDEVNTRQGMRAITLRAMEPMVSFMERHKAEDIARLFAHEATHMAKRAKAFRDYFDALYSALPKN